MTSFAFSCSRWAGVVAWLALPIVACTQVTEGESEPVQLALTVRDLGLGGVLEGVQVCGADRTKCVTTDGNGEATLELPLDQEVTWTLEKEGWGSILVADVTDETFVPATGALMPSDQWLSEAYKRMEDSPYPFEGTGSIVVWTDSPPFEGATFGIVEAGGEPRLYYGTEAQWPSLELVATTSRGWGGFIEVGPGDVEFEIGGRAERCVLTWGWPGDTGNTIRVPVQEGYSTHASVTCQSADGSQTEGGS